MDISFHIPTFVLWLIGIPMGTFILVIFIVGLLVFLKTFKSIKIKEKIDMKQDKAIDKIVYVVTRSEEHSDYVEAVFCKRENAEKYCKQFNDNEDEYSRNITEVRCLDTHLTNHWHKVEDELPPRKSEYSHQSLVVIVSDGFDFEKAYYDYFYDTWVGNNILDKIIKTRRMKSEKW